MRSILRLLKFNYLMITAMFLVCSKEKVRAQERGISNELLKIARLSDSLTLANPAEKLYLQFDKPYYALGDTIWFKAWLFNAADYTASGKSGILYIDVANDSNKVVKQFKLPVACGLCWGNITLGEKDFSQGLYTIRAYTNWMRNFGMDGFFYKSFSVSSGNERDLLVNARINTVVVDGKNMLNAKVLLSDLNKIPFAVKPVELQVRDNGKRLYQQKIMTGVDGTLDLTFSIPPKSPGLAIIAETALKDKKVNIPIVLNRPENADVQFLPEGGNLVAGLPARIGFKALGEDGRGLDISGVIIGRGHQQITAFKSAHNGIGSFCLDILPGENYAAKVTLPGGVVKMFALPAIKESGTALRVINRSEDDSLEVSLFATNDIVALDSGYFLLGKSRGVVCYAAALSFKKNLVKGKIAKKLFPSGITHFCLLAANGQPLNERLAFIDHHDDLAIRLNTNKSVYGQLDSVALEVTTADRAGQPVQVNFAMSVTDDALVKTDTSNKENMITRLQLTQELKGYVEDPGYYLSQETIERWTALDNLLLTQGWIGYDRARASSPLAVVYPAEHEFVVNGHVSNVFNKPVKGTDVVLFSSSPMILIDTVTDKDGRFVFQHFPRVDTPIFLLKAVNKRGKSFNVGVNIDETPPPEFIKPVGPTILPWYMNSDSTLLNYTKNNVLIKQQENLIPGTRQLKEVKIMARKIVKESHNLNGPGNADVVLDEKDLEKARKKSFLNLLEENVKGFSEQYPVGKPHWYYARFKEVIVLVDGVFLEDVFQSLDFNVFKNYLEEHNAEDAKGVEVMQTPAFELQYVSRFDPFANIDAYVFVEITTRGGHGPFIGNTPGMYLYKPMPLNWPAQFYKPKYAIKDAKHLPDLRSTIDWEPNITTGINGKAKLFFYTADKPSTYTITIEGTDMNGHQGYFSKKINIK
ncbi:hypothetical protein [Mucilaginibacter gotjawali]|uniref:MG2 domain protein n=2 Tax=Mucilaginibacter gotjawali TaxID=1550579 RepID=A0A110B4D6_9SPHI|nr:hypothetical protein [Mucilaginibacter gotjawali]MBB3056984.1 hypothetical protein [Mucilaginibacter gotjawali]BAU56063.1 MG2 domain protein [Mucilaginibacter gotjawali]